ncbi:MAG TPA: papain-like cysteine protease family protein, partial [Phytomonospora sp.]
HLNQYLKRALTLGEIGVELAKSAPFGVATYWRGGGGHAIVIRGRFVSNGVEYVSVSDPWDGDSDVTYDNFCNRYKDSGTWGNTYTTKA